MIFKKRQERREPKVKRQLGAAMVETAIGLLVFVVLLLGFFDFILLIFEWGKGMDVLRTTTRQLIVSEPISSSGELDDFLKCVVKYELVNFGSIDGTKQSSDEDDYELSF